MPTFPSETVERCYREAITLLRENSTPAGVLASAPTQEAVARRYACIFGRDAAICALGMLASGEEDLVASARAGLLTLARSQAPNGQIPKYVDPASGEVDFWYTGCIDATLWWLIAVSAFDRLLPGEGIAAELAPHTARALDWLQCQEHQMWRLLQQNEASDWADIMPRSGYVLYTNALWFRVKTLYGLATAGETRNFANLFFFPFGNQVPQNRRARLLMHYIRNRGTRSPFYLSFVNFSSWGEEEDIFANILACLCGLADGSRASEIVTAIGKRQAHRPYPVRVVGIPIAREAPLWRVYMERHRQNLSWQYHNGGIWPFVGGFWVILLARLGRTAEARKELEQLAVANRVNDWQFNEWFHGVTGEPSGMARQSWNAALFILALRTVSDRHAFLF